MLQHSSRLCLRPGYRLQWEARQDAWVLLFPEGMVRLNESAGLILRQCQRPVVVSELLARLQAQFPDESITEDVLEFLGEAYEQQWLELQ